MINIRFANLDDLTIVEKLAREIWPETYKDITPPGQLEYMLNLIYSNASLKNQLQNLHHTFLMVDLNEEPVGFASYSIIEDGIAKLHKIYVHQRTQGKGIGRLLIDFIAAELRTQNVKALRLNVNRNNKARFFYEKLGFTVITEEDIDIGNGFFMTDYVMEMPIDK